MAISFWLAVTGGSFWWNIADEKKKNERLAFETGRAFFQQAVITRSWNAHHDGVYVPVTKETQPNPYLEDSFRDLSTEQGIRLTKINPAYMTRQISEISSRSNRGIRFHITSLNPIRPENEATEWEKTWLLDFEYGTAEQGTFYDDGSNSFFRYMAPLPVENSCLKCHAKQGYQVGDIRGGISVVLPQFPKKVSRALMIGYGTAALSGVVLIIISGTLLSRKRSQLLQSNQSLEHQISEKQKIIDQLNESNERVDSLSGIIPICMDCKKIRDDEGYWNQVEQFISKNTAAEFTHSVCDKCLLKRLGKDDES